MVGNQLDDSQSLHKKLLFHQTSIWINWLFGVPGLCIYIYTVYTVYIYISYHGGKPLKTLYSMDKRLRLRHNKKSTKKTPRILGLLNLSHSRSHHVLLVGGFNPFKNISQIRSFPQVGVKIKNI